jgi:hypothetical protein
MARARDNPPTGSIKLKHLGSLETKANHSITKLSEFVLLLTQLQDA